MLPLRGEGFDETEDRGFKAVVGSQKSRCNTTPCFVSKGGRGFLKVLLTTEIQERKEKETGVWSSHTPLVIRVTR